MEPNRKATWFKWVGGDFGCCKVGREWKRYSCLTCARNLFPDIFSEGRWQGTPSKAMQRCMDRAVDIGCGGPKAHNRILREGGKISAV